MSDQLMNAVVATVLGTVVAILLLVPVAAYQYRLDGKLQPRDLAILLSGAIYGLALWTYTLLPMPAGNDIHCVGRQTTPFDTIRAIGVGDSGLAALARDPAFLQVALNVLLFVPLGYFVRQILHRGVVVATVLGFATSLLIETTQTTGVWHLYDCAYRLFDVDDLIINTLGATLGSLVAAIFVRRTKREIVLPTNISLGRRLMGMLSDLLIVVITATAIALAFRAWQLYVVGRPVAGIDEDLQRLLQWGIPALAEATAVLLAGRTLGEWVVAVRARSRRPAVALLSRLVKLATGVGPILVLLASQAPWSGVIALIFLAVTVAAAVPTREHRGLSHVMAGMDLEIVRRSVDVAKSS